MYILELEIPDCPPALNKILRTNPHVRNKANKEWYNIIHLSTLNKRPQVPLEHVRITLHRHSYRSLDFDNLTASFKCIVDGLTRAGIIKDDSFKITGPWNVDQFFRPRKLGRLTYIKVEECN